MSVDYSLLTTRALCDEATAEIEFELKTYTTREAQGELTDTRTQRTATRTTAQLAKVNAQIATQDILLATAGLDADTLQTATDERAALLVRRTSLSKSKSLTSGVARFFIGVDTEQIAKQVETLTTVKEGIATHRATLPA
ncbi:hypothetical protein [Hymenobacter elongatus]|uniref:Uncharacterized protein n=1 Tax=Hymenobacter elongatus TaxID=877208 RepID=A0A4Z0PJJ2_9BACT|nr:hypothetical protein [Hymenobacter elongatus]TGE15586.1 hypothetical protein E5J99_12370 [Hymenobacter elongatus]